MDCSAMRYFLLNFAGIFLFTRSAANNGYFHLYLGGDGTNSTLIVRCNKSPCRLRSLFVYAACINSCMSKSIAGDKIRKNSLESLTNRSVCMKSALELYTNENSTPIYSSSSPLNYLPLTRLLSSSDCAASSGRPCDITTSGVQILCREADGDLNRIEGFNLTYGPTFKLANEVSESEWSIKRGEVLNITCPQVDVIPSSTRVSYVWSVFHAQAGNLNISQQLKNRLLWDTWQAPTGRLTLICTVYDEDRPPRSDAFSYYVESSSSESAGSRQSAVNVLIPSVSVLTLIVMVPVMVLALAVGLRKKLNRRASMSLRQICNYCFSWDSISELDMIAPDYPPNTKESQRYRALEGEIFREIRSSVLLSANLDIHYEPLLKESKRQKIKSYMTDPDDIWLVTAVQKCENWVKDYPDDISTSSVSESLIEPDQLSIYCVAFKGLRLQITTPVITSKKEDWITLHRMGDQDKSNDGDRAGSAMSFNNRKVVETDLTIEDINRMANHIFAIYMKLRADVKGLCRKRNIEHIFGQFNNVPEYENKYRARVDAILDEIFLHVPDTSTYAGIQYELMKKIRKLAECNKMKGYIASKRKSQKTKKEVAR